MNDTNDTIMIVNEQSYPVDSHLLERAVRTVLSQEAAPEGAEVTIVLTTNDAIHVLNREHRDVDAPTDVLSFAADPLPPEVQAAQDAPYLGDLVIAFPYAKQQAEREGHALQESLALLVVHGTLHLLGYDHDTPENRAAMWSAQEDALNTLNIDTSIVPALEDSEHD